MEKNKTAIVIIALIVITGILGVVISIGDFVGTIYLIRKNAKKTTNSEIEEMIHYTQATVFEDGNNKVTAAIENNQLVFKSILNGKTYQAQVSGLSGRLKYFTYAPRGYQSSVELLVLNEKGEAYVASIFGTLNPDGEDNFKLDPLEFTKVNTSKKVVDITRKERKEFSYDGDVLCIKEENEKIKGIFKDDDNKYYLRVYDEVYPWQGYVRDQQIYVYEDGSIQLDVYDDNYNMTKQYLMNEANEKLYGKSVFVKMADCEDICEDQSRTIYVISKDNKLYRFDDKKTVPLDVFLATSETILKAKLVSNKTVKGFIPNQAGLSESEYDEEEGEIPINVKITYTDNTTTSIGQVGVMYNVK